VFAEGVFAAVFSFVFLGEQLTHRELLGCVLMLLATFIAKMGVGEEGSGECLGSGGGPLWKGLGQGVCLWGGRCVYLSLWLPYLRLRGKGLGLGHSNGHAGSPSSKGIGIGTGLEGKHLSGIDNAAIGQGDEEECSLVDSDGGGNGY